MRKLNSLSLHSYQIHKKTKSVFIDINLDMYTDLYNEWDFSPQKKRDMDEDLFNYIISCSSEIPLQMQIIIRMNLPEEIMSEEKEKFAKLGVERYFSYCLEKNTFQRGKAYRNMISYGGAGLIFLLLGAYLPRLLKGISFFGVLKEGLIIGGWVLFWESFSIIFFKDAFYRDKQKHLKRLIRSSIEFHYHGKKEMENINNEESL